jgi:hypothetical protein
MSRQKRLSLALEQKKNRIMRHSLGQNRVELLTPALSERCSNQLSYWPVKTRMKKKQTFEGGEPLRESPAKPRGTGIAGP